MRIEKDFLGEIEIPEDALYGIHALRARENFPDSTPFHKEWYQAMGLVKLSVYLTYQKFEEAIVHARKSMPDTLPKIGQPELEALIFAAETLAEGDHFDSFIVPAIQGGAGTSINMNVNEIISNLALKKLGYTCGCYQIIDPNEQANIYQSTNDVVPTALRIAVLKLLDQLEESINKARSAFERLEKEHRHSLRLAYTQMQAAVPSTYGSLFSTYCDALSRDWWRISKCAERIKLVNLGGGATGSGLAVPRFFIMNTVAQLQKLSKQPIAKAENLADATANLDVWVEIHAVLKAHAINLEKIANDIRLLSSDLVGNHLVLQPYQAGSSIMPGKVNPVICEYIISSCHKIKANDQLIGELCSLSCLDLNAYLPTIGHSLIDSLKLLISCDQVVEKKLLVNIKIKTDQSQNHLYLSPSICTVLNPHIGYHKASEMAQLMKAERCDIFEANAKFKFISPEKLSLLLRPENLLKQGFSLDELIE